MGVFDGILGQVSSALGNSSGQQQGLVGSVMAMINSQPGGLQGLVQNFESKGLGGTVQSWVGTGANQAITPQQIQQVLGNEQLQKFATEHGIDVNQVSAHLAQILPVVVDKLTPNGQVPQGGWMDGVKNLFGGPQG